MQRSTRAPRLTALTLSAAAALVLSGCAAGGSAEGSGSAGSGSAGGSSSAAGSAAGSDAGSASGGAASSDGGQAGAEAGPAGVVGGATVTDMSGAEVTVPEEVDSVIATDNRVFRTLEAWGVDLSAAPKQLMFEGEGQLGYVTDDAVQDIGNHREPDMEMFVTAEPDVVFNGQRFADRKAEIEELTGDAAVVDTDIAEDKRIDEGLKELTTLLGESTGHQDDAKQLNEEFDASIQKAKDAYDSEQTVMGLISSGGKLSYVAPGTGRAIGPMFDIVGLTPALEQEGSSNHQGDDISVEAIAESKPDWLIVMDRDAATGEGGATAEELIAESEALQDVPAVQKDQIVYLPADFYVAEDIQNYTTVMDDLAEAFEGAK